MKLLLVLISLFLAETGCVIQNPPGSAIRACAGDEVVIICDTPYNSVLWKWQNETVGSPEYTVLGIDQNNEITPNVPVDFPGVPGVTITLLTVASEGGGSINSSLQFVVSEEFVEARVTCNNQDYRDIVHAAECMLRATSIGVGNVVVDMNTTSFNLMWTINTAYNSSYFITVSANSENVITISTNESVVNLILEINLLYDIDISYEVNERNYHLERFKFLWFTNNNSFIQGNITGSKNTTLIIICALANICSNKSVNFGNTQLLTSTTREEVPATTQRYFNTKDSTMAVQVSTEAAKLSQGSRYESKFILPVGVTSVVTLLLVVVVVSIGCAVIFKIKNHKGSKESKQVPSEEEPVEYSHFQFHQQPVTSAHPDVYGTLNGDFHTEGQPKPAVTEQEEYSTLNQPHHKSPYVRDDYDYASIRYNSNVNTAKGAGEVQYSELGCSTSRSKMELLKLCGAEHNNTETEDCQADLLLNLDTILIELKHIAADWKKLGGHLGFSDSDMEIFQHATQGVDFDCLVELFEAWLKKTKKPTWRLVADALTSMGEEDLAQEILNIYKTGQLPDKEFQSGYSNNIFDCNEESDELPPPVPPQNFF